MIKPIETVFVFVFVYILCLCTVHQVVGDSGAGAFQNLLEEYSNMEQQLKM